jgi:hypothetical protein
VAVPLSYSLPAFRPGGWDRAADHLACLRDLGFRWVTLHPTFAVNNETHEIRTDNVPPVEPVLTEARNLGLKVRLEPHLDFESTLRPEPEYIWRNELNVDPAGDYFKRVLAPLARLRPDELTIGSELDRSTFWHRSHWSQVADELRGKGVDIGHKLNHDWGNNPFRRFILRRHLKHLDYQAVSFYTAEPWQLAGEWVIGEFGLGSTDLDHPARFEASPPFRTDEDFAARRAWYIRFLGWLKGREGKRAASFWTTGQYDVLGLTWTNWRDGAIVDAVRAYNAAQASP